MFSIKDYSFDLPRNLIAETAVQPAHDAKIMIIDKNSGKLLDESTFWNIPHFLTKESVLFFNNSRVLHARIPLKNATFTKWDNEQGIIKDGEIFFLNECENNHFEALVRPGKKFKIGNTFLIGKFEITVKENTEIGRILKIRGGTMHECMEQFGELPLPPYISYSKEKEKDYQSVFAQKNGSVASPTASLHFTEELLEKIPNEKFFVTLHIGLGTFKTIDTDDVREYSIHSEKVEVSRHIFESIFTLKKNQKIITAVGTTSCRTLESLPSLWKNLDNSEKEQFSEEIQDFWNHLSKNALTEWISHIFIQNETIIFSTRAYITPGYHFCIIDELITNFHLPESSLLVLIAGMIGQKNIIKNYQYAIKNNYRFFSFGDGMYIKTKNICEKP